MIFWMVLLLVLFAHDAYGQTYFKVAQSSGSDSNCANGQTANGLLTITKAFDCVGRGAGQGAGKIVEVFAGTYDESFSAGDTGNHNPSGTLWSSPFQLKANQASGTVRIRSPGCTQFSWSNIVLNAYMIIGGTTRNEGFILDGSNASGCQYVFGGAQNVRFQNNIFENIYVSGIFGTDQIKNVLSGGGDFWEIRNNVFRNLLWQTYPPSKGQPGDPTGLGSCKLHDTTTGGPCGYVIYLGASNVIIDGNEFYDMPSFAIHLYSYGCSAGQSPPHPCPSNNTVSNNLIVRASKEWHSATILTGSGDSSNSVFFNNVIDNTGVTPAGGGQTSGISINCQGGSSMQVYNNTVIGSGTGIEVCKGWTGSGPGSVRNNIAMNNSGGNIVESTSAGGSPPTGAIYSDNLCFGTSGTFGCRITGSNPGFVDIANNDYRLSSNTSPAYNQVINSTTCPPTDRLGVARPQFGICDIGAHELIGAAPSPQELVAAYGFDETSGSTVIDSSGKNNNGTFSTGVSRTTDGKYGSALSFDGTGGVTIPNSASLNLSTGFSIQAWVNPTSLSTDAAVASKGASIYYLFASIDYCGTNNVIGGFAGGNYSCYTPSLPTGTWTNVAVTYSQQDGVIRLYVDGVNVTTAPATSLLSSDTNPLKIGTSFFNEHFTGKIDSLRIYSGAIPPTAGASECINAPSILRDMNCPINPVTPPVAVTGFKVGSAGYKIGPGGALTLGQ